MTEGKRINIGNGKRRAEAKQPAPTAPPAATPDITDAHLQALVEGRAPPSNPYSAYIVEQLRGMKEGMVAASAQLREARKQVAALEAHLTKQEGVAEQYLHDLRRWETTPVETPANGAKESGNGTLAS